MPGQIIGEPGDWDTQVYTALTDEDQQAIKKDINTCWSVNILLVPLAVLIFFWGIPYFMVFLVFTIGYNIFAFRLSNKKELSLTNPKIIWTGKVTQSMPSTGDGIVIFVGKKQIDLTYGKIPRPIELGDTISLHYSQMPGGEPGILLKVEIEPGKKV